MSNPYIRKAKMAARLLLASFGKKTTLGNRSFSAAGFIPNRLPLGESHEPWLDFIYKVALATKSGTFIDVGANVGQTLLKVLALKSNVTYIGFEPQIECCFHVHEFIERNNLQRCQILPIGLSNKTGVLTLLKKSSSADVTASVIQGFRPNDFYRHTQSIFVSRGDDLITDLELSEIGIIKIDVEGGELEVLEGFTNCLRTHTPHILFEVLNHFIVATDQEIDQETIDFRMDRIAKIELLLRSHNYSIFNVLPDNGIIEIKRISPTVSKDLSITNYVAVHASQRDNLLNAIGRIP